jgi:hypothetical protein
MVDRDHLGTTYGTCQVKHIYIISAKKPNMYSPHDTLWNIHWYEKLRLKNKIPPPTPIPLLFFYSEIEDRRQEKVTA